MRATHLLVGLGNPGRQYIFTRHNAGFLFLDWLSATERKAFATSGMAKRLNSEVGDFEIAGAGILAIKPQTFMNKSGDALQNLWMEGSHFKELPLIVVHDEIDLPFGKVRIKKGGSDAGHNGLADISRAYGSTDYYRVRVGVGRPPAESSMEVRDWVLTNFKKTEEESLFGALEKSYRGLVHLLKEPPDLKAAQVEVSKE